MRRLIYMVLLSTVLVFGWTSAHAMVCDADSDGDVDRADISLIFNARNTPASGFDDPRDVDGNGTINVLDARQCVLQCTYTNCVINTPPTASIVGPEDPVCEGETIALDGSDSTDPDGDTLTFYWQLDVPEGSTATLSDPSLATPYFVVDIAGQYTVALVVNDGYTDSESVSFTVDAEGPEADAGDDQLDVPVGAIVTLDGGGSGSCIGNPLSYFWELTAPPGSSAVLSDAAAVNPAFLADVAGEYMARLIVNDGTQDSDPDTVIIRTESTASLRCGDLISGSIEEKAEVDEYTFSGQAGGVVTVTIAETSDWGGTGGSIDARCTVFSPSGTQLVFFDSDGQWDVSLPEDGTYTILVNANDYVSTGAYNVSVACITPAGALEAHLECGDLASNSIESAAEADVYTFTGSGNGVATVTIAETSDWGGTGGSIDARCTVFSPSGTQLVFFDSDGQWDVSLPEDGIYTILVNANDYTSVGSYNLSLACP